VSPDTAAVKSSPLPLQGPRLGSPQARPDGAAAPLAAEARIRRLSSGDVIAGVTVFRRLSRRRGVSFTVPMEDTMPSASRMTTPVAVDEAQIEGRYARLGGYTVSFETFRQDAGPAPYFAGLPGDRCQCAQRRPRGHAAPAGDRPGERAVSRVAYHWWWRPGWRPGRRFYIVHATFAGAPAVQALAAKARDRLAGLPGLDLIPGQWLHLTR
jgi:hypothetical protein